VSGSVLQITNHIQYAVIINLGNNDGQLTTEILKYGGDAAALTTVLILAKNYTLAQWSFNIHHKHSH